MLDISFVRQNLEAVIEKVRLRGLDLDLSGFAQLDSERKSLLVEVETLRHTRNVTSEKIAVLKKEKADASALQEEMRAVSARIKELDEKVKHCDLTLREMLLFIPNIPHSSVPHGTSAEENVEVRRVGKRPELAFAPRPHWEIGADLGILDFERASKITGSRFVLYWDQGARLERALINFMLDLHTRRHGYREVLPPFIVNSTSLVGTGNLPKFGEDLFKLEKLDYYLVPTAEVPVTNIFRDEVLAATDLPVKLVAYTPCFRSEAGSWGKDTRGLIRQHQFNKVELVKFVAPRTSMDELESLTRDAEEVLTLLGLHYRVVALCTGDMGFSSTKTYDIEVWLPGQECFREISSCSNFGDFQARRANIRYRAAAGAKPELLHTLNGSGLAIGRTLVAILENYQQQDGSVLIPEALQPFMDGLTRIEKHKR
ncbi:MAG: serine--tRNA ligase [Acidobacteria bacterium]|nr:serine--tRNA ligase [Acidobacteriota bacterium]